MSIKPWNPGTGPSGPSPGSGGWRGWRVLGWPMGGWRGGGRRSPGPWPGGPGQTGTGTDPWTGPTAHESGPLAAVFFDLDGLLVDSEPLWSVAESELAEQHGRKFTPEIKNKIIGKRLEEAVPILLAELGLPDADDATVSATSAELLARMATLYAERLVLQPGALILLDALRAASVPLALVSSSYRSLIDAALEVLGADRFAVTVAGDEVAHGKPDPEPYRTAAGKLGVTTDRCVVLEDTEAGAQSAVAAGCQCVIVPTMPVPAGPWQIVPSLLDVTVSGLGGLIRPSSTA
jgi:HAD superfamily hydrolase (TIGR01509 family)